MATASDMFVSIKELGEKLGFQVRKEVSSAFIPGSLKDYSPRVDLTWSVPIGDLNRSGLSKVIPIFDRIDAEYLPLIGFEVEAADPTTKTQISNIANLRTLSLPYGFIVVDNKKGQGDLYRRANRILRTYNLMSGQTNFGVLDYSQILQMLRRSIYTEPSAEKSSNSKVTYGKGGEKKETLLVREKIAKIGEQHQYNIQQDWMPNDLENYYQIMNKSYQLSGDPDSRYSKRYHGRVINWTPEELKNINKWSSYFTKSAIDVTWNIKLIDGLKWFIETVKEMNETMKITTPILRDPSGIWPILGFEIEGSMSKHGGGGIFNLSRYCYMGLVVVPESEYDRAVSKIRVYSRTSGIQNVFVNTYNRILGEVQ